ncbi:ATP-dependent Clp protease ATP-binding subunit [Limisalsivibrio acetivorans]|uniref:ATP-dependent Clp protease ATP-binding subunit n=1 Tax=Limisalsivibrio acetivorans TaxID=1304888 RepID=UPI0003B33A22|nr:ATP-dependent Clp protease ATP-binding subunit [Limisalsivibrio acetivorans]
MFDLFTDRARRVILYSRESAEKMLQTSIDTEHILMGLLKERTGLAADIFTKKGVDINLLMNEIKNLSAQGRNLMIKGSLPFSPMGKNVLEYAVEEAKILENKYINTEHILLGLMKERRGKAFTLLNKLGFELVSLREEIKSMSKTQSKAASVATPTIDEFGRDLTELAAEGKLDPVIGRTEEIERLVQILCRRIKNNGVIIGEPGVGKTAIVEGLAREMVSENIPEFLKDKRLISLELGSLVAGTKYRGQFEERMKNLIKEIENVSNIIVFIDEIHTIVGAGAAEGSIDASNMLKPALARGSFQCIGATTLSEYRKHFEKDGALNRRFQTIFVDPPTAEETVSILNGVRRYYQDFHKVNIPDPVLEETVYLTDRYVTDKFQPDKSIDVIDEACSKLKLQVNVLPEKIKESKAKLDAAMDKRNRLITENDFESLEKCNRDIERLGKKVREEMESWSSELDENWPDLDKTKVAEVVAMITGIPVQKLSEDEMERIAKVGTDIKKYVVGQNEAVDSLAKAIKRSFAGLNAPERPLGSYIFLGPTGVGKTEVAKRLAEIVFGSQSMLIRMDMSEFMEKFNVSKLIGAPPGYVGYEEGGKLTEQVRRKPYSVILFDEIEKAHPEVMNVLLQILDDGHIHDSLGHKVNFKNTVIIMTSNLGTKLTLDNRSMGFNAVESVEFDIDYDKFKFNAFKELRNNFSPEFLNRVDSHIVFKPLGRSELFEIIDLQVEEINERLAKHNKRIELTDEVKDFLLSGDYNYTYGARPIKRLLQTHIEDNLSEMLISGKHKRRKNLKAVLKDGIISFK